MVRILYIGKYFYIETPSNVATEDVFFSISGVANMTGGTQSSIGVIRTDPVNFSMNPGGPTITLSYYSYVGGVLTVKGALSRGYYILMFVAGESISPRLTVSWQTDPFACPHDPQYTDIYALTQGCSFSQRGEQGFPCLNFNNVTK